MATPDPRIKRYIEEFSTPGIPYVSNSHNTLFSIGKEHGHDLVWDLIRKYFKELDDEKAVS